MPAACTGPNVIDLQEYPILRDGTRFAAGKKPKTDRVVVARLAHNNFARCRIMTHEGAPRWNGFVPCD